MKTLNIQPKAVRLVRRMVQILSLLVFLTLFIFTTFMNPSPGLADLFYRLDPLVAITAMLAGRAFIAGLALAGLTLLLTVVFGRVWCGWLCPMGTTLDLFKPRRGRKGQAKKPAAQPPADGWRKVKYVLLAVLLVAAVFGNQSFLFLDPITIMTRTLANAIWPALRTAVYAVEAFLYQFEFLWGGLDAVHQAVVYPVFKESQSVYPLAVPLFFFFAGIIALNWVAERFWCRYLCPLGGLLGLISRFALLRRVVGEDCSHCAICSRHCPTGTIHAEQGFASDPAECTVCYDCIEACPRGGTGFRWQLPKWKTAVRQKYDPGRREALGALGAAAAWTALSGVEPINKRQPTYMVRPPGAGQTEFDSLCIRCNECVRVCMTQGLQPSGLEGGWQNLLTPHLIPRLGYCSYNCNACGQTCPTGAIPNLTLEAKRQVPIGLARVDRTRCLPWAYNIDCIVCEEACPLAKKAIHLDVIETTNARGEKVTMQRPYVIKELCIGCGMCEYQCPMGGDAAVRIFAYTEAGGYSGSDPTFGEPPPK